MSAAQWINYDNNDDKRYAVSNSKLVNLLSDFEESNANSAARGKIVSISSVRLDSKTIFIQDLGDPRVSLCVPLAVFVEIFTNQVIAYSYDLGEFGFAVDENDAIRELKADIVDLYFLLKEEQDNLGPLPQQQWNYLKSIIKES